MESLGYLDVPLIESQTFLSLCRFGGIPAVPQSLHENSGLLDLLLKCRRCHGPSVLVVQLWSTYTTTSIRILYLTCCISAINQENKCQMTDPQSWRVCRLILSTDDNQDRSRNMKTEPTINNNDDWLSEYMNSSVIETINEPPTGLLLNSKTELNCIKIEFINGISTKRRKDKLTRRAEELALVYQKRKNEGIEEKEDDNDLNGFGNENSCNKKTDNKQLNVWNDEEYEGASPDEKILRKFQKEIAKSPTQVIRYCFNGEPIWTNKVDETIPACPFCSASRVFEFQLLPNLISCLQQKINRSILLNKFIDNSNWGVLSVYSCSADCQSSFFADEFIIVCPEI